MYNKKMMGLLVIVMALSCASSGISRNRLPLNGRKALLIIAPTNFRDEEYSNTRKELEKAGLKVTVASTTTKPATGMLGMRTTPDITIADVRVNDYDLIAMPGGSGVRVFYKNQAVKDILRQAYKLGKVVGAICLAPVVLAKAGLLKGKKATSWRGAKQTLKNMGVNVINHHVVTDGHVVTGDGPRAAHAFGKRLVELLERRLKNHQKEGKK